MRANWNYPTAIRFGAGRIAELAESCQSQGILSPLFVTDQGLAQAEITSSALQRLQEAGLAVRLFAKVRSNPVEANLLEGLEAYKAGQHDGVIAFGGGSGLDLGKLIAFMSGQSRPVWDYEDVGDCWTRANPAGIAPIIAVPTTAGTGSEVGRAAVITDHRRPESPRKRIIFHPAMLPKIVICDPELTLGMPRYISVGTGMDALSHCLEAYCAPGFHPMAEGIAVEGIRLVQKGLARVAQEPGDLEARSWLMAAAAMGATAFQKGLGGMHALAHPIGALFDSHHGMTNATLMPYVLQYNRPAIQEKLTRLAAYLGHGEPSFDSFLAWIQQLRAELGVPNKLAELGVDARQSEKIAQLAVQDPSAGGNPLPFTIEAAREILAAAL